MLLVGSLAGAADPLPRHEWERLALREPDQVLGWLPKAISDAEVRGDFHTQALLHLARANACRVIADWSCQRQAGLDARRAAAAAGQAILEIRALIVGARGQAALQDFSTAETSLSEAERMLSVSPHSELSAEVMLSYSSINESLGRFARARDYAGRGLSALGESEEWLIRARLLRNLARALMQENRFEDARAALTRALPLVPTDADPKLSAELHLELARIARAQGDQLAQIDNGRRILEFASKLKNSQLQGLGHEVLGEAALARDDKVAAEQAFRAAQDSYRQLGLIRDERRVLRLLLLSMVGRGRPQADLEALAERQVRLGIAIDDKDHHLAGEDFEARLRYTEREFELRALQTSVAHAEQRALAAAEQQRLSTWVAVLAGILIAVLSALIWIQRRFARRLRASEARVRTITDHMPALIAHIDRNLRYTFANAAHGRVYGVAPESLIGKGMDAVHGQALLGELQPHIDAVLAGQPQRIDGSTRVAGRQYHFQANYLPDRGERGEVRGFFALTFDITALKNAEAELARLARIDPLTGLANRRQFEERLSLEIAQQARSHRGIALLALDIDRFKQINDTHGHPIGDAVIAEFGERIRAAVRENDLVARPGGDEFMILISDAESDSGEAIARKLIELMQAPMAISGRQLTVGTSIGVAYSADPISAEALIELADRALYQAKLAGRGTYRMLRLPNQP